MRPPLTRLLLLLVLPGCMALGKKSAPPKPEERHYSRFGEHDPNKIFDPGLSSFSGDRSVTTRSAQSKEFGFVQKVAPKDYGTRGFAGSKNAWMGNARFSSTGANTKGKYEIPNVNKRAGDKSAPVNDDQDANKGLATQPLRDGNRPFLGKESDKMRKSISAETMADWRLGGTTTNSGKVIDRYSELKELSLDDVREILNKNK